MRTTLRLGIFAAIVSVIAICLAPPVRAEIDGADTAAAVDAPGAAGSSESDLLGNWTGTIVPEGSPDVLDGGIISIGRDVTGFVVTVGPNPRVRYPSKRVTRTERGLRFEVWLPGDETRLLVYDLSVVGAAMTGDVTFVRHGVTAPASVAFVRQ